jgi:myo-inositol-1(or 4)-monophosphatase
VSEADRDLLARLESAVADAGAVVLAGAARAAVIPGCADPGNPTTDLDRQVDAFLHERLLAAFAGTEEVGYLSEERADDPARLRARTVLIVDPIDGTRSLLLGRPEAAVSVALWRDGEIVWGSVFNPFTADLFAAVRGGGTTRGGRPIRASDVAAPAEARLIMSVHEHDRDLLRGLDGVAHYTPVGSIAWKMALVAAGEAEATVTAHPRHEWDVAAGTLIVTEAGGRVTDARGDDLAFNRPDATVRGLVVSNGPLHGWAGGLISRLR